MTTQESSTTILSTFAGFAGNVNNMIGSGIFATPGIVWHTVGSPGVALILWILGGLISLCGSLTYAEFGTITLKSGGETAFFEEAFPCFQNLMSYIFSFVWICAIRPATMAAVLQALSQHFLFAVIQHPNEDEKVANFDKYCNDTRQLYNQLNPKNGWISDYWLLKLIGIVALAIITCYHMLSNKWANNINQVLTVVKMITLTVIIIIGFVKLVTHDSATNWANLFQNSNLKIPNLASALISIFFAYEGWNNLNYSLDEFQNPSTKLVYSNSLSVVVVMILYTLTNVAFITVLPSDEINKPGKDYNEVIAGSFARKIGGDNFARSLAFFVSISAFGAASSMTWSGSRVIVAVAKRDSIPFFSDFLRQWHDVHLTPYNALLVQFFWCIAVFIILGGAFSSDSFKVLSDFGIYAAWIFYFFAGVGLLWLRRSKPKIPRPFRVWRELIFIFVLAAIFIIIGGGTFTSTPEITDYQCQDNATYISSYIKSVISIGFIVAGFIGWYITIKRPYQRSLQGQQSQERLSQERSSQEISSQEISSQEISSQEISSQERPSQERPSQERSFQEKTTEI